MDGLPLRPMNGLIPQSSNRLAPQPRDNLVPQLTDNLASQTTDDPSASDEHGTVDEPTVREALGVILAQEKAEREVRQEATSMFEALTTRTALAARDASCWTEYPLGGRAWDALNTCLAESREQIQYGYFCHSETFVHQIPSLAHELLRQSLARNVLQKLTRLCSGMGGEAEEFGARIVHATPPGTKAASNSSRDLHQPDIFFSHANLPRCGLPVEIAYSQKRNRMPELAEFHILKSNRKARLLIAVDYDHNRTSKVTLCTWRRDYTDPAGLRLGCRVQELRTETGTLVPGPPLRITVLDFAPQELIPPFLHGRNIELSVEELCFILRQADSLDERVEGDPDTDGESSPDLTPDDPHEAVSGQANEAWPVQRPGLMPFPG
ncbi:uncharacterized protein Z519_12145 [Cladophialophora bantiana CBS 173.52]|uniref:Uncharacterized protein n=1 Tax=Cladophialophora bantiana (strain ATCC 10958 / CBS 173.52 / CDC B-1940 / NIH 8579) TaxID=1442370 RepID=A0A0D2FKM7_CLAB1|nr:uncharacterized protein Z519_12145 [Cladophialophora bantiana CBS 173.52]KIW87242.1 hypothetical protein Z519_12145 [Cladophialophora bantiana CBS 173.52]